MTETSSFMERFTAARAAYYAARDAFDARFEAEVRAEYARLRESDKAAGNDTSGKSVARRRVAAFDTVNMRDDIRAERRAVEAKWAEYKSITAAVSS